MEEYNHFMQTINPKSVAEQNEAFILDVRTPVEYREIHAPGSVLHPLHELDPAKVKEMAGDATCYVMCRSGNRAKTAAEKLASAGVKNVHVIEGGILGWEQAGLSVNRGAKGMSIERQVRIGAGSMVLAGVLLGVFVNPLFLILSGFVGCGLIFAGLTDWCGMGLLLARMPWNNNVEGGACCNR
jgi:rhodanese-related sulfurtransferase